MTTHLLSPNTQAILLLCARFGERRSSKLKPLTPTEYARLARWLYSHQKQPSDLLAPEDYIWEALESGPIDKGRLFALLQRGAALAASPSTLTMTVESWTNQGLWIISRSDPSYPKRLKARLKHLTPPILYGAGEQRLLSQGGLVIVGSRDVDETGLSFTRAVAERCVQEDIPIISGGARGVDSAAMMSALQEGGQVVGVLAHSLAKAACSRKYRSALREGHLVLVSACDPKAGFNVGNAMGRNKYMYGLGDWGLVISSAFKKGGTWAGATENLKHQWCPLLVRAGEALPEGNKQLLTQGVIPIDQARLSSTTPFRDWLTSPHYPPNDIQPEPSASSRIREDKEQKPDLFSLVWPYIQKELAHPRSEKELAQYFDITSTQMHQWLQRAVESGKAQQLSSPVRYISGSPTPHGQQLSLLG